MIKSYKLFTTKMCPKCPAMKEHMSGKEIVGDVIDASTPEGLEVARKYVVGGVPLVIFFDEKGEEVSRASEIAEVDSILGG